MPLATFVEDVEILDEAVREYYKPMEEGEGYILDVEPVNGFVVENVDSLRSALTKERKAAKDYKKKVETYESKYADLDPDEYKAAMDKIEELSQFDPEKEADKLAEEKYNAQKKRLETQVNKQWEAKINNEYEPYKQKYSVLENQLRQTMVRGEALKAIAEEDGDVDLLLPHVESKIKFEMEQTGDVRTYLMDKDGEPLYNDKGAEMSTREFVSSLKGRFPSAFKSKAKSGGGMEQSRGRSGAGKDTSKMTSLDLINEGIKQRFNT